MPLLSRENALRLAERCSLILSQAENIPFGSGISSCLRNESAYTVGSFSETLQDREPSEAQ